MVRCFKDIENIVCYGRKEDFIEKIDLLKKNLPMLESIGRKAHLLIKNKLNWSNYINNLINQGINEL